MRDVIIEVDKLSKVYRLGSIGTGSFRQDMQRWWSTTVLKKQDPFFLTQDDEPTSKDQHLWALRDVSFEIKRGEALGIIGSNGSGKSTLLKIISKIVKPTSGVVRGRGKISSLLEVGTGFHHELSGRENIFMSGYTLGMSKEEIRRKFDEIVAFSGVEKFLDTPVKRYSSGMYVRLAFAVAAHLEPDILIVDEVLAVGDADFQQKCLGKMQEVSSSQGRTVIFVSHNLHAIANLCTDAVWLEKGKLKVAGTASEVVSTYLANVYHGRSTQQWDAPEKAPGNSLIKLKKVQVKPICNEQNAPITINTPIQLEFEFWSSIENGTIEISLCLKTTTGVCVFDLGSPVIKSGVGVLNLTGVIPANLLNDSSYSVTLVILKNGQFIHEFADCANFDVEDMREGSNFFGPWPGIIRPKIEMSFRLQENMVYA